MLHLHNICIVLLHLMAYLDPQITLHLDQEEDNEKCFYLRAA